MKRILSVFASYCDAYLEYVNNFITVDAFCDFYNIRKSEFMRLHDIVQHTIKPGNLPLCAVDCFMQRMNNKGKYIFPED